MNLTKKLAMANKMVKQQLISESSYKLLLRGFKLIEQDKLDLFIKRAK